MSILSAPTTKPTKFSKDIIAATIDNHPEGVLTTINPDGTPASSVVTLHTLSHYSYFFMTKDSTKKYDNLETNPSVTFMIFDPFSRTELEISGIATYICDTHTRRKALKILDRDAKAGQHHTSPFVTKDDAYALYDIHPKSIRFTTFADTGHGPEMYKEALEFSIVDTDYAV